MIGSALSYFICNGYRYAGGRLREGGRALALTFFEVAGRGSTGNCYSECRTATLRGISGSGRRDLTKGCEYREGTFDFILGFHSAKQTGLPEGLRGFGQVTVERGLTGKGHLSLLAVLLAQVLQATTEKERGGGKWTTAKGKKAGRCLSAPGLGKLGHCRADVPGLDPGRSHSVNLGMEWGRETRGQAEWADGAKPGPLPRTS